MIRYVLLLPIFLAIAAGGIWAYYENESMPFALVPGLLLYLGVLLLADLAKTFRSNQTAPLFSPIISNRLVSKVLQSKKYWRLVILKLFFIVATVGLFSAWFVYSVMHSLPANLN